MDPVSDHGAAMALKIVFRLVGPGEMDNQTCAAGSERREERDEGKTIFGRCDLCERGWSRRTHKPGAGAGFNLCTVADLPYRAVCGLRNSDRQRHERLFGHAQRARWRDWRRKAKH